MGVLLEAKSLKKTQYRFKNFKWDKNLSVKNVSLYVNEGEIVGMLGPNGAGKSTSLKMITGDLTPDEGRVIFDGQDITTWPMYKRCSAGLGYMAQENTLFKQMTVENNLIGIMQMQGFTKQECRDRCEELMELFNLNHIRNNLATNISGGEKRRLEVARALTRQPKMLILDEPFAGVDPKVTQSIIDLVFDLWENWGIAILITDHDCWNIIQMVQRCYLISSGEVVFDGTPEDLINNQVAQDLYFGQTKLPNFTYDENGRIRVNSRHSLLRDKNRSDLINPVPETVVQNAPSILTNPQNVPESEAWQYNPQFEDADKEQVVSEDASEKTEQTDLTKDSELSDLLQSVQTNEIQSSALDNAPSPKLADFFPSTGYQDEELQSTAPLDQTPEPQTEEPTDKTNVQQRQRKVPPSSPSIKPFKRKK